MPKSKESAAPSLPCTSMFHLLNCLQNSVFIRAMLKPIFYVTPWAAHNPDLKMEFSIFFYSLLKKSSFLKSETNYRALVRSLKAWILRFLCTRVEEYLYSDAVDGGAVKGCAAGKEQGMHCASSCTFCSLPAVWRDAHLHPVHLPLGRCSQHHKDDRQKVPHLICDFSLFLLMSENRNVASTEIDPCVQWDAAQESSDLIWN